MASYSATQDTKRRVRQNAPNTADVAIIGAGLGGLVAGAYLARSGKRVACFDSHYVAGGCATMFSRGGGQSHNFDVGLHYIGDCGPEGTSPESSRPGYRAGLHRNGSRWLRCAVVSRLSIAIPVGTDRYRDRMVEFFPEERKGIDRYIRFLKEVDYLTSLTGPNRPKSRMGAAWSIFSNGRLGAKYRNATIGESWIPVPGMFISAVMSARMETTGWGRVSARRFSTQDL